MSMYDRSNIATYGRFSVCRETYSLRRKYLAVMLAVICISFPGVCNAEKPRIAIAMPIISGNIPPGQSEGLIAFFQERLTEYYQPVSAEQYTAATRVVFKKIRAEQCTEGYCIYMIKQELNVGRLIILELAQTDSLFQLKVTLVRDEDRLVEEAVCMGCDTDKLKSQLQELIEQIRDADQNSGYTLTGPIDAAMQPKTIHEHFQQNRKVHLAVTGIFLAATWQLLDEANRHNELSSHAADLAKQQQAAISSAELSAIRTEYETSQAKMDQIAYRMNLMQVIMATMISIEYFLLADIITPGVDGDAGKLNMRTRRTITVNPVYQSQLRKAGFELTWTW